MVLELYAHCKYVLDLSHVVDYDDLEINEKAKYGEEPFKILNRDLKRLPTKEIPMVKVQYNHHDEKEASWEVESEVREKYSPLLKDTLISGTKSF